MTPDRSHSDSVGRVANKVRVEGDPYFYVPKYPSFDALPAPEIFWFWSKWYPRGGGRISFLIYYPLGHSWFLIISLDIVQILYFDWAGLRLSNYVISVGIVKKAPYWVGLANVLPSLEELLILGILQAEEMLQWRIIRKRWKVFIYSVLENKFLLTAIQKSTPSENISIYDQFQLPPERN